MSKGNRTQNRRRSAKKPPPRTVEIIDGRQFIVEGGKVLGEVSYTPPHIAKLDDLCYALERGGLSVRDLRLAENDLLLGRLKIKLERTT